MELAFILIAFVIGIVGGFFIGNSTNDAAKKLEDELKGVQDELNQYRSEVTDHFARTAELFNSITANYRALYHHLAEGAQKLCAVDTQLLGSMPKLEPLTAPIETKASAMEKAAVVEGEKAGATEGETLAGTEDTTASTAPVQTASGEAPEEKATAGDVAAQAGEQAAGGEEKAEAEEVSQPVETARKNGNGAAEEQAAKLAAASSVERSMEQATEKRLH